jgi:hypothetical protein
MFIFCHSPLTLILLMVYNICIYLLAYSMLGTGLRTATMKNNIEVYS